jgi:hypothetical protein
VKVAGLSRSELELSLCANGSFSSLPCRHCPPQPVQRTSPPVFSPPATPRKSPNLDDEAYEAPYSVTPLIGTLREVPTARRDLASETAPHFRSRSTPCFRPFSTQAFIASFLISLSPRCASTLELYHRYLVIYPRASQCYSPMPRAGLSRFP